MKSAVAGLASLLACGCSLAIGDIELPAATTKIGDDADPPRRDAEQTADAAPRDARLDAAPPADGPGEVPADLALDGPVAPPADAWVLPPDVSLPPPIDGSIPLPDFPIAPPVDLTPIRGFWYVDGLRPQADGYETFAAALRIEADHAVFLTNEAVPIEGSVELVPAGDLYGTWLLTLPGNPHIYRGAFAPNSGFAVFAPEASDDTAPPGLLLMARVNDEVPALPPDSFAYTRIGVAPATGDGEVGSLRQIDGATFRQESRYVAPPGAQLADRDLAFVAIDPWRYSLYDSGTGDELEVVATSQGTGVIGAERRIDQAGTGLVLGWAARPPGDQPRAGELFCGGLAYDRRTGMRSLSLAGTLPGDGGIQWVGGFEQTLTLNGTLYVMADGLNPFLQNGGVAVVDGLDEVLTVLPLDPLAGRVVWGMLTCVRTDLIPLNP